MIQTILLRGENIEAELDALRSKHQKTYTDLMSKLEHRRTQEVASATMYKQITEQIRTELDLERNMQHTIWREHCKFLHHRQVLEKDRIGQYNLLFNLADIITKANHRLELQILRLESVQSISVTSFGTEITRFSGSAQNCNISTLSSTSSFQTIQECTAEDVIIMARAPNFMRGNTLVRMVGIIVVLCFSLIQGYWILILVVLSVVLSDSWQYQFDSNLASLPGEWPCTTVLGHKVIM